MRIVIMLFITRVNARRVRETTSSATARAAADRAEGTSLFPLLTGFKDST